MDSKKNDALLFIGIIIIVFGVYLIRGNKFATDEFYQSFSVYNVSSISLENRNGEINIIGTNSNDIEIYAKLESDFGKKELEKIKIDIDENPDFKITTKYNGNPRVSIKYEIKIPSDLEIKKIELKNGELNVKNMNNNGYFKSANAEINLENINGSVIVESQNGDIDFDNVRTIKKVNITNGSINGSIYEFAKDMVIETVNGDIDLHLISNNNIGKIDSEYKNIINAVNASIDLKLSYLNNDLLIETVNGDVDIEIDQDIDAIYDISTDNGKIDFEYSYIDERIKTDKRKTGIISDGGKLISIKTKNGNIDFNGFD